MTKSKSVVYFLTALACLSSPSFSQDAPDEPLQKALVSLTNGKLVRIACDEYGTIGGKFVRNLYDSLHLGADERSGTPKLSKRRARRQHVISLFGQETKWKSVEEKTRISHSSIRELHVQGRGTLTGAIVGGIVGGGACLLVGIGFQSIDDSYEGGSSSDLIVLATVGMFAGGIAGGLIGSLIPKWHLRYREPGFRAQTGLTDAVYSTTGENAGVSLAPILTIEPGSHNQMTSDSRGEVLKDITVSVGIQLTW